MEALWLFVFIIALMLAGVPISVSLGVSSIGFLLLHSDASLASVAQTLLSAFTEHYTLLAIPFFVLASGFMSTGGVARRIIRFSIAVVGHVRGGLAIASVFACMMFAALSGSSPATVVAIGTIVIAGMRQVGYSKEFAAGVICNAGTLGILIPPSIVMVVYAAATDVSVGRMFLAGVLPGLLAGVMLMIGIYVIARVKGLPKQPWRGWREVAVSFADALWGLLLILIILGGIYSGKFTPTEAAAIAAMYAFFVANFIYRDMGPLYVDGSAPIPLWKKPHSFLLLLLGGQFMEPSGLLIIVAPLVFPIAIELGIDPIHLGIIMVVNMEIGMITPPVGLNLFVTAGVAKLSVLNVVKAALPFVAILFVFLIIVTYFPPLSTWLPTLVMGPEIITR